MNLSENCQSPKISNFKARFYLPDCHSFNSTINNRIKSAVIKNNSLTNKNIHKLNTIDIANNKEFLNKSKHRKGFVNINKIYSKEELEKYKTLSDINYNIEYNRPQSVLNTNIKNNIFYNKINNLTNKENISYENNKENTSKSNKKQLCNKNIDVYPNVNNNFIKNVEKFNIMSNNKYNTNNNYNYFCKTDSLFKKINSEYNKEFKLLIIENKEMKKLIRKEKVNINLDSNTNNKNSNNTLCNINQFNSILKNVNNNNIIILNDKTCAQKGNEANILKIENLKHPKEYSVSSKSSNIFNINKSNNNNNNDDTAEGFHNNLNRKSFINCTSINYNPINFLSNNINTNKAQLINNLLNYNCYKPKIMSGILDLNRNGAPNINQKFREAYNNNNKCFNINKGLLSNYYDTYHTYKNSCKKPFS